jgi:hypothetical protein
MSVTPRSVNLDRLGMTYTSCGDGNQNSSLGSGDHDQMNIVVVGRHRRS